jgi:hypothetical protein
MELAPGCSGSVDLVKCMKPIGGEPFLARGPRDARTWHLCDSDEPQVRAPGDDHQMPYCVCFRGQAYKRKMKTRLYEVFVAVDNRAEDNACAVERKVQA